MKWRYFILLLPLVALAQVNYSPSSDFNSYSTLPGLLPGLDEQINVNVSPENPAPNDSVTISLDAPGTDLNRAEISWLLNGRVVQSGTGQSSYTFTASAAGSVSNFTIMILPEGGQRITKTVTINPGNVDIAWEAPAASAPPFYQGKKLYPHGGQLVFMALPNLRRSGTIIDSKTLIYQWFLNDTAYADKSGYGKNTFVYIGDILDQPVNIRVKASTVDGSITGEGVISVTPLNSQSLIYEDSPSYGLLFNKAVINTFNLNGSEVVLAATPYYFTLFNKASSTLKYSWILNGQTIASDQSVNKVTFRKPDNITGRSSVGVSVTNGISVLQNAASSIMVDFSNSTTNNVTF